MENCAALVSLRRWSPQNNFEGILRLGWWWNDEIEDRNHALFLADALKAKNGGVPFISEPTAKNMERLIEVLSKDAADALIVGDIQRRLGNFDAAVEAYLKMPSYQAELSGQLMELAQMGYRSVVRLK
jgi:hypothetical protein